MDFFLQDMKCHLNNYLAVVHVVLGYGCAGYCNNNTDFSTWTQLLFVGWYTFVCHPSLYKSLLAYVCLSKLASLWTIKILILILCLSLRYVFAIIALLYYLFCQHCLLYADTIIFQMNLQRKSFSLQSTSDHSLLETCFKMNPHNFKAAM